MDKTLFPLALFLGCMCIFTATETGFYFTMYTITHTCHLKTFLLALFSRILMQTSDDNVSLVVSRKPHCVFLSLYCCHLKNSKKKYTHQPIQ